MQHSRRWSRPVVVCAFAAGTQGWAAGFACAVACLAVSFAVGGVAAVLGALAGEWWLVVGLGVAAVVVGVAVVRRRRTGKIC